ncbi:MAG TPA: DUF2950 domain-containing protein [Rhodospirillales bacterium]|nr:DUF2950 domain-containing protein [Rhodospirillales bacterium]
MAAAAVVAAEGDVEMELTNMTNIKHILNIAAVAAVLALVPAAFAQNAYPTPEAAAEALIDGIARHDGDAIKAVVGADYLKYIPASSVDPEDVTNFLEAWARAHAIVPVGSDKAFLGVGKNGWTMPIPIVKTAAGWRFDTKGAPEEMRVRRIGRNELAAIQVALAYTDAQKEYLQNDWNGDGVREYAMRGLSTPGKRDGLYWASLPGEPESPIGAELADAKVGQPYHGYLYKILTAQGTSAPGGARSYIRNGRMTEGYALVAWPAKYDDTGVMTFIVNQDGIVYQKNLGPNGGAVAKAMKAYDPDSSWQKAQSAK